MTETTELRRVIVVDTETTGLDPQSDVPVEVAWEDYATGESGVFVPSHDVESVLRTAHPTALEVNGYRERIAPRAQDDGTEVERLHRVLTGATLVGSAPQLDVAMLAYLFGSDVHDPRPWHHRVVDLGSYAAGVLGLPLGDVPGLWRCCELLGVTELPNHGAAEDVRSTVACLRALDLLRGRRFDDGGPIHATLVDGTVLRDRTAGSLGIAGGRS